MGEWKWGWLGVADDCAVGMEKKYSSRDGEWTGHYKSCSTCSTFRSESKILLLNHLITFLCGSFYLKVHKTKVPEENRPFFVFNGENEAPELCHFY